MGKPTIGRTPQPSFYAKSATPSRGETNPLSECLDPNNTGQLDTLLNKRGTQNSIHSVTSKFQGNKRNTRSKKPSTRKNLGRGNRDLVAKTSYRTCTSHKSEAGFLQFHVSSRKAFRRLETNHKPQTSKSIHKKDTFQNGNSKISPRKSESRSLGSHNRPFRRLLSCGNS